MSHSLSHLISNVAADRMIATGANIIKAAQTAHTTPCSTQPPMMILALIIPSTNVACTATEKVTIMMRAHSCRTRSPTIALLAAVTTISTILETVTTLDYRIATILKLVTPDNLTLSMMA